MGAVPSRRRLLGLILTVVSAINLCANGLWLLAGDRQHPGARLVMRGGWTGFWVTTVLFGALLAAGLALLLLARRSERRIRS